MLAENEDECPFDLTASNVFVEFNVHNDRSVDSYLAPEMFNIRSDLSSQINHEVLLSHKYMILYYIEQIRNAEQTTSHMKGNLKFIKNKINNRK